MKPESQGNMLLSCEWIYAIRMANDATVYRIINQQNLSSFPGWVVDIH